jgi:DNA replication and repair protein RecF
MVHKLSLRDFRCFARFELEFHPEVTCIVGGNALGKTSLLEGVAVLTRLQSPRTSSLLQVIRSGAQGLVTDGLVDRSHLQFYYSAKRRKLALDSVEQKDPQRYLEVARLVFFGCSDIDLVRGAAEERRRFLDFLGSQLLPTYRKILRSYEKAVRSRNAYLKMSPARPREILAYTKPLLDFGNQLTALRNELVRQLEPHVAAGYEAISDRGEPLAVRYHSGATADFEAALAASAKEEGRLRATVVGPHRDDIRLLLHDRPANLFGSEGQQRTLSIALKLGQAFLIEAEFGRSPVLLLDDIFGELDRTRRNRLVRNLPTGSQKIITTTSLSWLDQKPAGTIYELKEDAVKGRVLVPLSHHQL